VNDVLLAAVAGAIRAYLEQTGELATLPPLLVRATAPLNLRRPGEPVVIGNKIGLISIRLPCDVATPLGRLDSTRVEVRRQNHWTFDDCLVSLHRIFS
jgi:diacylglycerol O-acyltransferase